jgi:uncharacterized protein
MSLTFLEATARPYQGRRWLAPFTSINAVLMALISLWHSQWPDTIGAQFYLVAGMIFHFSVLSFLVTLCVLIISFVFRLEKHRLSLAIVLFTAAQLIIITNVKVFNLYHFHLNGMVINLLFSGALLENIAFSWIMWLAIAAILIGALFGQRLLLAVSHKISLWHKFSNRHHFGFFLFGYIVLQLLSGCADAFGWNSITAQNRYIPWMPTTTMRSSLEKMGFEVKQQSENLLPDSADGLNYPIAPLQCAPQQKLNVLMLVVDSLRFDQLTPEIMPNTYQLKNQALSFENHYSTSNATRYGLFSLMYGLSGSYWKPMLAAERGSALFDLTVQHNYQHFIYGSSTLTFPEFDRTIFSTVRNQLQSGNFNNSADNDRNITERFIQDLNKLPTQQPFFGFLFFDAPHGFSIPKDYSHRFEPMLETVNYLSLNSEYNPVPFLNLYKTTAHYVDSLIHQIIEKLASQQRLQNTIVIITSDHGQEFNETGKNFWGHNSNFSQWQTKVPLLILWPGKPPASVQSLSNHEDLIPSLLGDAFACSNPVSEYSTGQSLFQQYEGNSATKNQRGLLMETWTERAILYDNHLYLIDPLGDIDVVDQNYDPVADREIPSEILANIVDHMSRFLKAR